MDTLSAAEQSRLQEFREDPLFKIWDTFRKARAVKVGEEARELFEELQSANSQADSLFGKELVERGVTPGMQAYLLNKLASGEKLIRLGDRTAHNKGKDLFGVRLDTRAIREFREEDLN